MTSNRVAIPVMLNRGMHALVSAEDYDRVIAFKWTAYWTRWGYYAKRMEGKRCIYLHRFILDAPAGIKVDHENGDGLNCCRWNLRLATNRQNSCNRRKSHGPKRTSKFKGVDLHSGRWRARIRTEKGQICLGHFSDQMIAARCYDAAARELHGEFARVNFPEASS